MKLSEKQVKEARGVYDLSWESYLRGDAVVFATLYDEDMTLIGTAESELFFNKVDAMAFLRDTVDQISGKVEMRNRDIREVSIDAVVRIDEFSDMYVLLDSTWTFYAKMRVSTLLRQVNGQWKIFYQHGSFPDPRAQEGETLAPEQIKQENYQLREAIKRRTIELENKSRELELEGCLERVRAQAMSMKKSEDLLGVCEVLFKELCTLKFDELRNTMIDIYDDEHGSFINHDYSDELGSSITNITYDIHPVVERHVKLIRSGKDAFQEIKFSGAELEDWREFRRRNGERDDPRLEKYPTLYYYFYSIGVGDIGISSFSSLTAAQLEVLKRFRNVFDFAYRRYMDVTRAEKHPRESHLELSLERVRARSMAMHRSDELVEAADVFFEQLSSLGIETIRTGVAIFDAEKEVVEVWSRSHAQGGSGSKILGVVPRNAHPFFEGCFDTWKRKEPFFFYELVGDEVAKYYRALSPILSYPEAKSYNPKEVFYTFFFPEGSLNVIRHERLNEDELNVLQRFAAVFGQIYRRFLELQLAEAQARESKVEAALERIRSRTMAMQKSDELTETSFVLFEEFKQLGEIGAQVSIGIFDEEMGELQMYATSQGSQWQRSTRVRFADHEVLRRLHSAWKGQQSSVVVDLSGDALASYNEFRRQLRDINFTSGFDLEENRWVIHAAFFSKGLLSFSTRVLRSQETMQMLERFAGVFDLTYTRFLDLKQAEAQAKEARIEAALERVRAKAMAMHDSHDLSETSRVVFAELRKLGIESQRCGVVLLTEGTRQGKAYATAPTEAGESLSLIGNLLIDGHPEFERQYDHWQRGESFNSTLRNEELQSYYDLIYSQLQQSRPEIGDREEHGYYFPFSEGWFYSWTLQRYTDDQFSILTRFKAIIELTFRRYLDLEKAEAQTRDAQIEASLERVRSRTLAMQKSEELAETAAVLFRQLILLGIAPNRLYIAIIRDESANAEFWITDEDGTKVSSAFSANLELNGTFRKMLLGRQQGETSLTIDMHGDELQEYFRHLSTLNVPFKGGLSQTRRVQTLAYFSKGFIGMASPDEQPEETIMLLERFAAVFNLTFTRFNDLQLAEAQARQAHLDLIQLQTEKRRAEDALSELRAMQAQLLQQEKLASLGQLTAGIAHEIKNPLNFVNNFSSVSVELLDEVVEEIDKSSPDLKKGEVAQLLKDIRTNLTKIIQHGTRADGIVKSMLQHSRGGTGKKEPVDLNVLVKEFANLAFHGMRAGKNPINVDIVLELSESVNKVSLIAEDFSRVIINLCQNAFDAMRDKLNSPAGKSGGVSYLPKLTARTRLEDNKVVVEIADNGPGIPDAIRDKILQPFFTTKKGTQGTGLGLSITHDIVKAHGGEMQINTNEDGGATFLNTASVRHADLMHLSNESELNMKFLVVDDERDIELLFQQHFRKELRSGVLELVFAFSGQEAIDILDSSQPPDVVYVFSDINMPGMTGLELLEIVSQKYPDVHVSMISAYGGGENHKKAMASGAKEFFTKPIDFERLKQEVYELIGKQKSN